MGSSSALSALICSAINTEFSCFKIGFAGAALAFAGRAGCVVVLFSPKVRVPSSSVELRRSFYLGVVPNN